MKQSKRNQNNQRATAERRADGPPIASKYAIKLEKERQAALRKEKDHAEARNLQR